MSEKQRSTKTLRYLTGVQLVPLTIHQEHEVRAVEVRLQGVVLDGSNEPQIGEPFVVVHTGLLAILDQVRQGLLELEAAAPAKTQAH